MKQQLKPFIVYSIRMDSMCSHKIVRKNTSYSLAILLLLLYTLPYTIGRVQSSRPGSSANVIDYPRKLAVFTG